MKKIVKTLKLFSSLLLCSLLFALCYLGCEQPFKAGLGPMYDLQDPTIILTSPPPNAFVRGETKFTGEAADDTQVDSVYFQLTSHPNVDLTRYGFPQYIDHKKGRFYKITNVTKENIRKWTWEFTLNTKMTNDDGERILRDGFAFTITLLVLDSYKKYAYTDGIPFTPKNRGPQISMTAPAIPTGTGIGDLGGDSLNFNFIKNHATTTYTREMTVKSTMVGGIIDDEGINRESGPGLYPPQIRFWQVYLPGETVENPKYPLYALDYLPNEIEVRWQTLGDEVGQVMATNSKNMAFFFPLPDDAETYYRFEVRAQSIDAEKTEAHYPQSYVYGYDDKKFDPDFVEENSNVLIVIRAKQTSPTLELYGLEDIFGEPRMGYLSWLDTPPIEDFRPKRVDSVMQYNILEEIPDAQTEKDGNHVYVNKTPVIKGGPFTLRMKAYHPGGIASAEVYWEKANSRDEKGRFIWDPANERKYLSWVGNPVPTSENYEKWGYNEPDGNTRVSSFVFTYTDKNTGKDASGPNDRIPNTSDYYDEIRGRSKIQRYTGPDWYTDGEGRTKKYDFDQLPKDIGNWRDQYKLDEGTYNLYVYATSKSGTRIDTPFVAQISIDRSKPTIELLSIAGSAGEAINADKEKEYTVNGVVSPKFLLSEEKSTDTDFRTGTLKYFVRPREPGETEDSFYTEKAYIVIPENQRTVMDAYLALDGNSWPKFPDISPNVGGAPAFPGAGVTIRKHGVIINSSTGSECYFRTSKISAVNDATNVDGSPEEDYLQDGKYRLYVFVRDNAFNVNSASFPINVLRSSDDPTFDWTVGTVDIGVTDPDWKKDYPTAADKKSFIVNADPKDPKSTNIRNKFTANSAIRVKIKDDDSLDLGVGGGDPSKVIVTLIGSRPVGTDGTIKAYDDPTALEPDAQDWLMRLSDTDIKTAFAPQTMDGGNRLPVKERTGTITQAMLLNALKTTPKYNGLFMIDGKFQPEAFNSLPDGIYRVGFSIQDYPGAKLRMPAIPGPADADSLAKAVVIDVISPPEVTPATKYFWIAVDGKPPAIEITKKPTGIISPTADEDLEGKVSDENGPITLIDWSVKNGNTVVSQMGKDNPNTVPVLVIPAQWYTTRTYDTATQKWVYNFEFKMRMNGNNAGNFTFELKFQDRFGNTSTEQLRFTVDDEPPKVSLTKKIKTFSRNFDDVYLDNRVYLPAWVANPQSDPKGISGYKEYINTHKDDLSVNKLRLAVKTVNFSINAVDNNRVEGVRWWLLPATMGVDASGTTNTGLVCVSSSPSWKGYDAFPSGIYKTPGSINYLATGGAYGVVDVNERKFTIDVDSTQLLSTIAGKPDLENSNGEFRLHIIAIDAAGNESFFVDDTVDPPNKNLNNVFQVVFFLQEEDKPYLPPENGLTPGALVTGATWPTGDVTVIGGAPMIRGTIYENNGFDGADGASFWPGSASTPGSLTIWFSNTEIPADLPASSNPAKLHDPADPANWEYYVAKDLAITGYDMVKIPNPTATPAIPGTGINRQGLTNINLGIELSTLFPNAFKTDGKKRYIIKATDSPVGKLKWDGNGGIEMGGTLTTSENEVVRVSRWKQYAFIYDARPPKVVIEKPDPKKAATFGSNFDNPSTGFNLVGYISDANLQTDSSGNYYFEYYLDNNEAEKATFTLTAGNGVTLKYYAVDATNTEVEITYTPGGAAVPTKVHFDITPTRVAAEIIKNFKTDAFTEGTHTLTLSAKDKTEKSGYASVNFIKDTSPPTINFINLTATNHPGSVNNNNYDSTNKSGVDKVTSGAVTGWWNKTEEQRKALLLATGTDAVPIAAILPLSTIYYDTGVPELRGTITDTVSNIDIKVTTNSDVGSGDINDGRITYDAGEPIPPSSFKYWIDDDPLDDDHARYLALIDGAGTRSVRWTILLTDTGKLNGNALPDGVHTIVLTVADTAGEGIKEPQQYMIAFRIDSKPPKATIKVIVNTPAAVYGNVLYQNPTMFTVGVEATDANLEEVELRIVKKAEDPGNGDKDVVAATQNYPARANDARWTYSNILPTQEDVVAFSGSYGVLSSLFTNVTDGKYDIIVAAVDTYGNRSDEFVWSFTYDKTPPDIVFTNPGDAIPKASGTLMPENFIVVTGTGADRDAQVIGGVLTPNNDINRLVSEQLRIQGNVIDKYSPVRQVQSQVDKYNWISGKWEEIDRWQNILQLESPPLLADNKLLQIAWTKNLLGQDRVAGSITNGGTGLDLRDQTTWKPTTPIASPSTSISPEGLYRIRVRAKDFSFIQVPPGDDDWDLPQGKGNPTTSGYVYFFYDRTDPTLEVTYINNDKVEAVKTYYSKPSGGFTFEGTVTDNNRFAKVEVRIESNKTKVVGNVTVPAVLFTRNAVLTSYTAGDPAPTYNVGGVTQNWAVAFPEVTDAPDGRYKITVTVYDMTGRSSKMEKSFILDSTPPGTRFTLPTKEKAKYKGYGDDSEDPKPANDPTLANGFASAIVNGGETSVITGETWDMLGKDGESGSESGLDRMWFRLGYIDENRNVSPAANNNPFPTKAAIEDDEIELIIRFAADPKYSTAAQVRAMPASERNDWMDKIAKHQAANEDDRLGNAWFRLAGTPAEWPRPTGFVIDNPNVYDWRMEIPNIYNGVANNGLASGTQIGGLKYYTSGLQVKGRRYNYPNDPVANRRYMVRAVDGQAGVYRLPLWVRIADLAGNVQYYCHDIWIYPDGDVPSTTIESPANGSMYTARGGTISVDGVAKSNTSVYDVIFRVAADGVFNTNLDGVRGTDTPATPANPYKTLGDNRPADGAFFKVSSGGVAYPTVTNADVIRKIPPTYRTTDWQRASLTLTGGSGEPLIPWSILLNSDDQIQKMIQEKGFNSSNTGSPTGRDMIRVWLEVFVFNGEGSPIRSSIYPDDNLGTASQTPTGTNAADNLYGTSQNNPPDFHSGTPLPGPRPYVKSFYIKSAAPKFTDPNVASLLANNTWRWNDPPGYKGAGTEIRRDKFAIRAVADPNSAGSDVSEISYRIKLDGGSYGTWTTVLSRVNGALPTLPLTSNGVTISRTQTTPWNKYQFEFHLDSKATATSADYAAINSGNWANSGGTITVQIRMKDSLSPPNEAETTIQVAVDNFAPVNGYDSNGVELFRTNSKVAGTNVDFMGRAYDYATVSLTTTPPSPPDVMVTDYTPRKIDRIYAWFMKNGQYVNMNVANTTTPNPPGARTMSAYKNRKATVVTSGNNNDTVNSITMTDRGTLDTTVTYPGLGGKLAHNADYIRELSQGTALPGTGMVFSPVNSRDYDVRWSFTLDSTLLPDGDITLCYLVVDAAILRDASGAELVPGNASYYEQKISVRNKYPVIDRLTLYTDNNGQGAAYTQDDTIEYAISDYRSKMFNNMVDYDKRNTTGYLNSGFISKNKYIGFKVETRLGNGAMNFRLQHVTRKPVKLTKDNLADLVANKSKADNINLYTIAWHGDYSSANWKALGVPIDNPPIGTHFVLTLDSVPSDFKDSQTAEVWQYTQVIKRNDVTNVPRQADDTVVLDGKDEANFTFKDTMNPSTNTYFDFATPATKIGEYKGSHPDYGNGDANEDDPSKTAFFLIRVWDSINPPANTNETTRDDQLYDALVVGMNVYLRDITPPTARLYDLNPYTEIAVTGNNIGAANQALTIRNAATPTAIGSNIVRGGLFNTKTERELVKSGYIDPRNGSGALNPANSPGLPLVTDNPLKVDTDQVATGNTGLDKVSGRVILRGLAQDDQLIGEIRISINGVAPKPILRLTNGKMAAVGDTPAYATETLHWKTGHTVEWAYVWDTETEPTGRTGGGPLSPVSIQVSVADQNGSPANTSVNRPNDADATLRNGFSVDIVPYVIGFERQTPRFETKRSLQGWYSFYQGEQNIAVLGYNLGQASATVNLSNSAGGAGTDINAVWNANSGSTAITNTQNRFSFTIPSGAASGRLNVRVGSGTGTTAYNHTSSNTNKSWNSEYNSYTPGSDLWINKPYAHIWRSINDTGSPKTYIGQDTGNTSAGLEHPGMALEYQGGNAGRLHATWAVYGNAVVYYGNNNGSANAIVSGTPNEPVLTPDISMYNGTGDPNIAFTSQDDGTPSLRVKSQTNTDGATTMQDSTGSTQRWKNVRIRKAAANGSGTNNVGRIYMTANDAQDKRLWYGRRDGTSNSTFYIDGGNTSGVGGLGTAANAGEFSAVDYDETGPIIAYYDQTNDTVRVALGTGNANAAGNFTRNYLLPSGHSLFRGSGRYISIKVDKDNHIHLSFYNSVYNTVVYYYAGSRSNISQNGTAPNNNTVKVFTIDRVITGDGNGGGGSGGGLWTDISVDNNGNPWIVYGDSSRTGNYDGVRIAYLSPVSGANRFFSGDLKCPVTGADITGWEALTMPAAYIVKNDRLNIEAWPPTARGGTPGTRPSGDANNWQAAIGYPSDLYRVGYFYYPAWKGY